MTSAEFAAWTGGILALLGILAAVARLLMLGHRTMSRLERIEHLANELAPNSGSSIKDTVHRTERKVDEAIEHISDHETRLARTEGRVEAIALVTSPTMLIEDDEGLIREARARRD